MALLKTNQSLLQQPREALCNKAYIHVSEGRILTFINSDSVADPTTAKK